MQSITPITPIITNICKGGFSITTIRCGTIKTERQKTFPFHKIPIPIKTIDSHVFALLTKTTSVLGARVGSVKVNGSTLNKTYTPLFSQLCIFSYLHAQGTDTNTHATRSILDFLYTVKSFLSIPGVTMSNNYPYTSSNAIWSPGSSKKYQNMYLSSIHLKPQSVLSDTALCYGTF